MTFTFTDKNWRQNIFLLALIFLPILIFQPVVKNFLEKYFSPSLGIKIASWQKDWPTLAYYGENYFGGELSYNTKKAEQIYQTIYADNPRYLLVNYQLGRLAFLQGDFTKARFYIEQEQKFYPQNYKALYMGGLIEGFAKNYDQAIKYFESYVQKEPRVFAGWNDLAWVYFAKGDYQMAHLSATRGLTENPENPWLLNALGVALLNLNLGEAGRESAYKMFDRAERYADNLKIEDWGKNYPGNDPAVYQKGLEAMQLAIKRNKLLAGEPKNPSPTTLVEKLSPAVSTE